MVTRILERFGQIDILVNVAGKSVPPLRPPFLEMSKEYWDMVMDRNLRTMLNCCRAVLPHMVERNQSSFMTGAELVIDGGLTIVEPMASGPQ